MQFFFVTSCDQYNATNATKTYLLAKVDDININLLFLQSLCELDEIFFIGTNRAANKCNYPLLVILSLTMF